MFLARAVRESGLAKTDGSEQSWLPPLAGHTFCLAEGTGIEPVTVFSGNCLKDSILVRAGPLPQKRDN
jgi:hypothetical protein